MKLFGTLCMAGILTVSANAATIFFDTTGQPVNGQDGIFPFSGGSCPPNCDANGNQNLGNLYASFSTGVSANATGFNLNDLKLNLIAGNNSDGFSVSVGLYLNGGTNIPGGLVQTLGTVADSSLNNCVTGAGSCQGAGTVIDLSALSANLLDNTRYWIGLSTSGSALWNFERDGTGTGTTGEFTFSDGNGQSPDANGAYILQVSGSDNPAVPTGGVPEPATFVLLGSSVIALGLFRRQMHTNPF